MMRDNALFGTSIKQGKDIDGALGCASQTGMHNEAFLVSLSLYSLISRYEKKLRH